MKTTEKAKTSSRSATTASTAKKTSAGKSVATKTASAKSARGKAKTATAGKVQPKRTAAEDLRELFVDGLKDIYWAEKALLKALPKMAKNTTTADLVAAINEHTVVTQGQADRLEKVFSLIGEKAVAKKCEAMDGLIKEGEEIMKESQPGPVRDAGIISASQKIEHYEIASYGTLCAFAKTLGEEEAGRLLHQTLEEEKEADLLLTERAYNSINFEASQE